MGSCISKCKPNKNKKSSKKLEEEEEDYHVNLQDKLVIVAIENPPLKSPLPPQKTPIPNSFLPPFSPSPSHSSSSSSSFSCTTTWPNTSSSSSSNPSLSSTSSCASSVCNTKDKSPFTNELSKSCHKANSPIVLLDPNKLTGNSVGIAPSPYNHHQSFKPKSPAVGPTQKRQRANSPNLTRQKSFRSDPVGPTLIVPSNKPSSLRSPSPSRRFISNGGAIANKKVVGNSNYSKGNVSFGRSNISVVKRENLKGLSDPNSRSRRSFRSPSMRKEAEICSLNRVVSRVDGITIGEERGHLSCLQDVEMLPVEDLNNPLIALDCFIFL